MILFLFMHTIFISTIQDDDDENEDDDGQGDEEEDGSEEGDVDGPPKKTLGKRKPPPSKQQRPEKKARSAYRYLDLLITPSSTFHVRTTSCRGRVRIRDRACSATCYRVVTLVVFLFIRILRLMRVKPDHRLAFPL